MKILILEDDKTRIQGFRRGLIGHEVFFTEFASEAIKKLSESNWDYLFLDHDLGGKVFVEEIENTGYQVALWLEQNPDKKPENILLHSLNPNGRMRMQQALPESKEAVFAWTCPSKFLKISNGEYEN